MLSKYEAVSKEKKIMQEEKIYYFQRKVDALEHELKQQKGFVKFAEKVIQNIVPRLNDLLEQQIEREDKVEQAYLVI